MELKDYNITYVCKKCGTPVTWRYDEELKINFLEWECQKCGALVLTFIDKDGNIIKE